MRLSVTDVKLLGYKKIAFNYLSNENFISMFNNIYEIFEGYKYDVRPYSMTRHKILFEYIPREKCELLSLVDLISIPIVKESDVSKEQRAFKHIWDCAWKDLDIVCSELNLGIKSSDFYKFERIGIRQPYILNDLDNEYFKKTYILSESDKEDLVNVFNMFNDIFIWTYLCRCGTTMDSMYLLEVLSVGSYENFRNEIFRLKDLWSSANSLSKGSV